MLQRPCQIIESSVHKFSLHIHSTGITLYHARNVLHQARHGNHGPAQVAICRGAAMWYRDSRSSGMLICISSRQARQAVESLLLSAGNPRTSRNPCTLHRCEDPNRGSRPRGKTLLEQKHHNQLHPDTFVILSCCWTARSCLHKARSFSSGFSVGQPQPPPARERFKQACLQPKARKRATLWYSLCRYTNTSEYQLCKVKLCWCQLVTTWSEPSPNWRSETTRPS